MPLRLIQCFMLTGSGWAHVYPVLYREVSFLFILVTMSISLQRISYIHPDKEPLFENISLSVTKGDNIALIGHNGSGKSTLLRIMAGLLPPTTGTIVTQSEIYYVPQHFGQYNRMSIAEALGVDKKIGALQAIENGNVSEISFTVLNDEWDIEEKALAALSAWGLDGFPLDRCIDSLSGGEKTKVFLAGMLLHPEATVLLDEPTNHLDDFFRKKLYHYVQSRKSTLIIVSHDRTLLNLLDYTFELGRTGISVYGGNYEFYKEQKNLAIQNLQDKLEEKEKLLRLARKIAIETAEKKQKHEARGKKHNSKKGVSRIVMGNLKSSAEKSSAKLKDIHAEKTGSIQADILKLRRNIPSPDALKTDFNSSDLHKGKLLIKTEGLNYSYENNFVWKLPVDLEIRSGERIVLKGINGSGKTTLIKLITGKLINPAGTIFRNDNFTYVYLDQEYSIIRNDLTILEQVEQFNLMSLPEHEVKTILNRYLFSSATWDKSCAKLSGGEKMRLAFCCLMIANNTPDMFILDEPTNNLDIRNIEIITSTIKEYTGTVLVVSHDEYFLNEIGVDRSFEL